MCADGNGHENMENHVMKKDWMRAMAAVGAVLWAGVALAADAGVLRLQSYNVLAKSLLLSLLGDLEFRS